VTTTWRLLLDGPTDAAENMARDRAVQLAVEQGIAPPTLRLYQWSRPTVTLGRHQPLDGIDLAACRELGVDVVRRFTGGRGVLHDDELTYAVVARVADGIPRGVAASYRYLCEPLAGAFRALGVDASVTERDRGAAESPACYLATTRADLSLGALKLSGSAQVWLGATVLQHGSFTFTRDVSREALLFRLDTQQSSRLREGSVTIDQALGERPDLDSVVSAITSAFEGALGITLEAGALMAEESERALQLIPEVLVRPQSGDYDT
jgi:lipoate-protein ligase A